MPDLAAHAIPGYELLHVIGRGGHGDVYKARQLSLNRFVAIKVLHPDRCLDEVARKRFFQEARSVASLSHEGIVQAHDMGELQGSLYFVMEFVDGETLSQLMTREGALPERRALEIAQQVAAALEYIHLHRLVHRDIKPDNIILAPNGRAKILDLGLVRATEGTGFLTTRGTALGTPTYMSPEQIRCSSKVDIRSDLYSLGATLYFILSGDEPYTGADAAEILEKVLFTPLRPLRDANPRVSAATASLVERILAKDPAARFQTPAETREAIASVLAALSITPPTTAAAQSPRASTPPPAGRVSAAASRAGDATTERRPVAAAVVATTARAAAAVAPAEAASAVLRSGATGPGEPAASRAVPTARPRLTLGTLRSLQHTQLAVLLVAAFVLLLCVLLVGLKLRSRQPSPPAPTPGPPHDEPDRHGGDLPTPEAPVPPKETTPPPKTAVPPEQPPRPAATPATLEQVRAGVHALVEPLRSGGVKLLWDFASVPQFEDWNLKARATPMWERLQREQLLVLTANDPAELRVRFAAISTLEFDLRVLVLNVNRKPNERRLKPGNLSNLDLTVGLAEPGKAGADAISIHLVGGSDEVRAQIAAEGKTTNLKVPIRPEVTALHVKVTSGEPGHAALELNGAAAGGFAARLGPGALALRFHAGEMLLLDNVRVEGEVDASSLATGKEKK